MSETLDRQVTSGLRQCECGGWTRFVLCQYCGTVDPAYAAQGLVSTTPLQAPATAEEPAPLAHVPAQPGAPEAAWPSARPAWEPAPLAWDTGSAAFPQPPAPPVQSGPVLPGPALAAPSSAWSTEPAPHGQAWVTPVTPVTPSAPEPAWLSQPQTAWPTPPAATAAWSELVIDAPSVVPVQPMSVPAVPLQATVPSNDPAVSILAGHLTEAAIDPVVAGLAAHHLTRLGYALHPATSGLVETMTGLVETTTDDAAPSAQQPTGRRRPRWAVPAVAAAVVVAGGTASVLLSGGTSSNPAPTATAVAAPAGSRVSSTKPSGWTTGSSSALEVAAAGPVLARVAAGTPAATATTGLRSAARTTVRAADGSGTVTAYTLRYATATDAARAAGSSVAASPVVEARAKGTTAYVLVDRLPAGGSPSAAVTVLEAWTARLTS